MITAEAEITDEVRKRAAQVARELAEKVKNGMKFETSKLYTRASWEPACALGQLHSRLDLPKETNFDDFYARAYDDLKVILGGKRHGILPRELQEVISANDSRRYDMLVLALNNLAASAEKACNQSLNDPNLIP